jgi:hypothetical protein
MKTARKLAFIAVLAAAFAAAGIGSAETGKAASQDLEVKFDSSFVPKTLPPERSAPIALSLWGRITAPGGSHPPALTGLRVDGESLGFSVGNHPPCHLGGRQQRLDVAGMRKACRASILGSGRIEVEVAFPDQRSVPAGSELLVLNGDSEGRAAPFVFGYLPAPVTGQLLFPLRVNKASGGPGGIHVGSPIPEIANGYGSITYFRLDFKQGVFQASCPNGALGMSISGTFASNSATATALRNRC